MAEGSPTAKIGDLLRATHSPGPTPLCAEYGPFCLRQLRRPCARAGPFATRPFATQHFAKPIRRPPISPAILPPPPDTTRQLAASRQPRPAARPCQHPPAPASQKPATSCQPASHHLPGSASPAQPPDPASHPPAARQPSAAASRAAASPSRLATDSALLLLPPLPSIVGDVGERPLQSLRRF
ncbi:uncharacterized protein PSFLO_03721 [Pseudozyma flocculosa]|uniref:Uncharacterized protein n=1 Tax=Pseudozyma flocculosa TaxID=84751 RepID=A0A5C3F152_9BASI|nr:uncharacterized protein PSFLO_03721 [Pseudozyma flocculosa]